MTLYRGKGKPQGQVAALCRMHGTIEALSNGLLAVTMQHVLEAVHL